MLLIASKRCFACLLICLVFGLGVIAQTTSQSERHESDDADTPSPKTDRTDKAPQRWDASGDHDGKKAPQDILIDSRPDIFDAFLATREGKCVVGAVSVAIGMVFMFIRRTVSCANVRFLKNKDAVTKYVTVIRRDALLLFASLALMLGMVYLVWSIFPVQ